MPLEGCLWSKAGGWCFKLKAREPVPSIAPVTSVTPRPREVGKEGLYIIASAWSLTEEELVVTEWRR
jgi:hypothetical protein